MRIYNNISDETIDSWDRSLFGNELIFEYNNHSYCLLPCVNLGFYDNVINPSDITYAIEESYLLFNCVNRIKIRVAIYDEKPESSDGFSGLCVYNLQVNDLNQTEYYVEGVCYRNNSFSYMGFTANADSLSVVIMDDFNLEKYNTINYTEVATKSKKTFLLNRNDNLDLIIEHLNGKNLDRI